jgi:transketolase
VDGHDPAAIAAVTQNALNVTDKPSLIACRTIIGFGSPKKQGTKDCHGSPLGAEEVAAARKQLGWDHEAFVVPENILKAWRDVGRQGATECAAWNKRHAASKDKLEFDRMLQGDVPEAAIEALKNLKAKMAAEQPKLATRATSGAALEVLLPVMPELIGGSADLTPSNNTQVKNFGVINPANYGGHYVHFGVREHGMAACMNGMALHGGLIPYGGTFMQFADYCRPSIRLAALMHQRVIFIMTHDSIGVGEDGPTHQPVEHLASLRAIPNLLVFRPCDGVETAECWELALRNKNRPSLFALSRQNLPTVRSSNGKTCPENLSACGGYILATSGDAPVHQAATAPRDLTIMATGSEVSIALTAREALQKNGLKVSVVSMPCFELFDEQSDDYRAKVLGAAPRIAIEAGIQMGWEKYLGIGGVFVGMTGFGASAPGDKLYTHFGITADNVVQIGQKLCRK